MRLFIAEKPSVANALAEELGITKKHEGYIECGSDKITWCFGHMLELAEPDEYTPSNVPRNPKTDKKIWRTDELPIIPESWIIKPKEEAKKQLKIIETLLKEAHTIVNAGDSDREGQLLIDEVLDYFKIQKPVVRFWVSAHDSVSLQRGLASMGDNVQYSGLSRAALSRSRADWLIGMNLSRAYTLSAQRGGCATLLTVGRVQTPTLALVVSRDRDIEAFKSTNYYTIKAAFQVENHAFLAAFQADEFQEGLDSEGRMIDLGCVERIINEVTGRPGIITHYSKEPKKSGHPRAYSLSDITLKASQKWGYTATEVLDVCQSLYETHKLTSYPRTDNGFLPESQWSDAPKILEALKQVNPELTALIEPCDTSIKSSTWDDRKVGAHYGIIPTQHKGCRAKLTDKERAIYDLIVRAYIAQFYPLHEYFSTTVQIDVQGLMFQSSGKAIIHNGWRDVYGSLEEEDTGVTAEQQNLPLLKAGDAITCVKATRIDGKTKPPARFNEGTLQRAMENIHKYIVGDEHKKMLKEGDGIGTSATRASIISELKRREFLETKGRTIISTALGRSIIDALPEAVKSPILTAINERILKDMERDGSLAKGFIERQTQFVTDWVKKANSEAIRIAGAKPTLVVSTQYNCRMCNKGLVRRLGKKGFWWSCSQYPQCSERYPDIKGQPVYSVTNPQ
ncbi:TPA: DNA topoisomerase 3 [Legionella pneumophila]|nr:DNA topoisomerase 3 [Legionella pneumophila]HCD9272328.1 DNA topoisomerase 3 [Legionella pneumophila]HCD9277304.1 DNA topoisomerase 3 [Legionella pneumophila]HCD9280460.1 DNA topoisomerase 3 [Legionella pneumophila]HCD9288212.1 DNA topoisomerase 3 [Legionella pneumophila]